MAEFRPDIHADALGACQESEIVQHVMRLVLDNLEARLSGLAQQLTRTSPFATDLPARIALIQGEIMGLTDIGEFIETQLLAPNKEQK